MKEFIEYITKNYDKKDFIEIRFLGITNQKVYNVIEMYSKKHNIELHKGSCLFFNKENMSLIYPLITYLKKYAKICYGVNPREQTDSLAGDYEHVKKVHFIYFDVEPVDINIGFEKNLNNLKQYLKRFGLKNPTIVDSGWGRHIIYKIKPQIITEAKKEWYKEFVNQLRRKFNLGNFRVDIPKDFTRVLGIPGSFNIKRDRPVKLIELNEKTNRFKIKSKKIKKKNYSTVKINAKDVLTKIVKILMTPLPEDAPINNVVWFNFKILLRDMGLDFDNLPDYIKQIRRDVERIQNYNYPFNKPAAQYKFSAAALNKFCKEYNIDVKF